MEDIIVLFYKYQHNNDPDFTKKAKAFIEANLDTQPQLLRKVSDNKE
jgi:hypothetical protein